METNLLALYIMVKLIILCLIFLFYQIFKIRKRIYNISEDLIDLAEAVLKKEDSKISNIISEYGIRHGEIKDRTKRGIRHGEIKDRTRSER